MAAPGQGRAPADSAGTLLIGCGGQALSARGCARGRQPASSRGEGPEDAEATMCVSGGAVSLGVCTDD